jgi:CRP/FNR family transcriptional regulator
MDVTSAIAEFPLFEGLPESQQRDLAAISVVKNFSSGQTIFVEGSPADGFYIATSGQIKIYKISPEGKEQILHVFGPGEPFGEVPVFEGKNFPANAVAMKTSRILFLPRSSFINLIKSNPSLALNMLAVLSKRLRTFTALVEDLSLKEVPARLAAHLLSLREAGGGSDSVVLEIPKNQLASLLGTIPETLSRIMTKMSKEGLIEPDGKAIKICDSAALQEVAEGARRIG